MLPEDGMRRYDGPAMELAVAWHDMILCRIA